MRSIVRMAPGSRKALLLALSLGGLAEMAAAQIVTDGTLGPRRRLGGADIVVDAGLGRTEGRNLFHSFERFGVRAGTSATFDAPDGVTRVIARVTGGRRSQIDGRLGASRPIDVVLLNPSGIRVGQEGRIETGRGVALLAADAVGFTDGGSFTADPRDRLALSAADPNSFGFLSQRGGLVRIEETEIAPGGEVVLAGREIQVVGSEIAVPPEAAGAPDIVISATGGALVVGSFLDNRAGDVFIEADTFGLVDAAAQAVAPGTVLRIDAREAVLGDAVGGFGFREGFLQLGPGSVNTSAQLDDPSRAAEIFGEDIVVSAADLRMRNALLATINNRTLTLTAADIILDGSILFSDGQMALSTGTFRLVNSQVRLEPEATTGAESDIVIGAFDLLLDDSTISIRTTDENAGVPLGRVLIEADDIRARNGSGIGFVGRNQNGGVLSIVVDGVFLLDGSFLASTVEAGTGTGGVIVVTGGFLALRKSFLAANADVGAGGFIDLRETSVIFDNRSFGQALSNQGPDGVVATGEVFTPQAAETEPLPTDFFDAFALVDDACVATVAGGSALRREGRGGTPMTGRSQPALFAGTLPYPEAEPDRLRIAEAAPARACALD